MENEPVIIPFNPVQIRIKQAKRSRVLFGREVPFLAYFICRGDYSLPCGSSFSLEKECSPVECLTDLLMAVEAQNNHKHIGPICAEFDLTREGKSYRSLMTTILDLYARSKRTTFSIKNDSNYPRFGIPVKE